MNLPAGTMRRRNDPCPCGSGQKYKSCCGRIAQDPVPSLAPSYPGWEGFSVEERATLWQTMQQALDAQRAGRIEEARSLYGVVLDQAPDTFDAVHMLGVVEYQLDHLDRAEELMLHAMRWLEGEAVRNNLELVRARKRAAHSVRRHRTAILQDMTAAYAGLIRVPDGGGMGPGPARDGHPAHIVMPGDVLNPGPQRGAIAMFGHWSRSAGPCVLWSQPQEGLPDARLPENTRIDPAQGRVPQGGTLVLFGLDERVLDWLPEQAAGFSRIDLVLDAHDPAALLLLLDALPQADLRKIGLVARSRALLQEYGVDGIVDPWLFAPQAARPSPRVAGSRVRAGVFLPPTFSHADDRRWALLEWMRRQDFFLRVLYYGALPSRHVASADEHLVSLVSDWNDGWCNDLDLLLYWSLDGRMRQFDRLVLEAHASGLAIVADATGDYAEIVASDDRHTLFLSDTEIEDAVIRAARSGAMPVSSNPRLQLTSV
jgi:hypothetical protein